MQYDDKIPIYYQIKNFIYREIIVGNLKLGEQLPAVRQLAVDLTVNVNTIQRALSELIAEKVIESKRGKGNFVTEDETKIDDLRRRLIDEYLSDAYNNLHQLNVSDQEIIEYLNQYIEDRRKKKS
ncbi:MAG: GntR family transcriptional regulator [Lentilactobacillus diolivorans]|uniref:GntR family transcriptional regulator n=2 Tax=Lentilactobacillus diolivorans TaxID=179838 RepID=A0A0R1SNF8_9LACO|nr:GntR family transcriptional regulator [Lentilactobacillus diolivorans]KRL69982.1 GntR family transcriptional regulator [Lentilactobacillus diolivorans DSM 14421]MDH5105599.1 GntR family transcriptional regulator [Lentilactobacillus diolivorans]GEP24499.1 GntR family transcriptional regulator [Lentilactobacillus diolivorans]